MTGEFLIQLTADQSEADARAELERIFGYRMPNIGQRAILKPGVNMHVKYNDHKMYHQPQGFRCYLPK